MLAWWLILAELGAARARAIPIPSFLEELRLERPRRWPCFLISGLLHVAILALLPSLSDWLEATRPERWVRRYRMLPSVEVRVPERLYLAATPRAGSRTRPRRAAARDSRPRTTARNLLPGGALRPAGGRERRFELPRLPARSTDQTLLQPDFSADLPVLARLSLPDLLFWAPLPHHPAFRIRKPFVTPGSAEPFAQPPAFDAPPQLTAPNWEAMAATVQAASASAASAEPLLPPSISLPIRLLDMLPQPPRTFVSVERAVGDPLSVLALNPRVRPVREELVIPPGNQLAQGEPVAGSAAGRAGGAGHADPGAAAETSSQQTGPETASGAGSAQHSVRANPEAEARAADPGAKATAQPPEPGARAVLPQPSQPVAAAADSTAGSLYARNAAGAASGARPAPAQSDPRREAPAQALRIEHPPGGVADVVVVQPAPMEGMIESTGALSGRPVYTVFLQVGAPRDWVLQYCVPGEDQGVTVTGGVVRLAQPGPLTAPYPRVTYLPTLRPHPNSYLLIHGYLGANGRLEGLTALRTMDREEAAAILPVLERWEFRPAMREGRPVRVEILLAIPRM